MRFLKSKKGIALLATLVVAIGVAVGAYAYFTSSGSGAGTALSGDAASGTNVVLQVRLQSDFGGTHLTPGGTDGMTIAAWNTGITDVLLHSTTLASVTDPGGASGCISYLGAHQADFTITPTTVTDNTIITGGTNVLTAIPLNGATLNWANNDAVDQTPCADQSLTVTMNWS